MNVTVTQSRINKLMKSECAECHAAVYKGVVECAICTKFGMRAAEACTTCASLYCDRYEGYCCRLHRTRCSGVTAPHYLAAAVANEGVMRWRRCIQCNIPLCEDCVEKDELQWHAGEPLHPSCI